MPPSSDPPLVFAWDRAELTHRGCLPHVRQAGVIYFITFRLGDSLPADRVAELRENRSRWLASNPPPHSSAQELEYRQIWSVRIENLLDAGCGACALRDPQCRDALERTLRHDDGRAFCLGEFVTMPNPVHLLARPLEEHELSRIIKAWKSISSRRINSLLQRTGPLWMEEYFDHVVRDVDSLDRFVAYIRNNPQRLPAGTFTLGRGSLTAK